MKEDKKWEKALRLYSSTSDIVHRNPSGDYEANFIPDRVVKSFKVPNTKRMAEIIDDTANGNLLRSDGNNQDVCWVTGKFIGIIRAFVESNTVVVIGNIHDNPELL